MHLSRFESLAQSIEQSVRASCEGRDVAVAFSGGLDSGLVASLASRYARSVTLYTTGTENAFDVRAGKELADILDLPWVHCRITKGAIEGIIRELTVAGNTRDPFTISYEVPLYCVCREASEDTVLTGQGSDEYFGGCAKLVGQSEDDFRVLLEAGVRRLWEVSIPCERSIAASFGKSIHYPYLTDDVVHEVGLIDPALIRPEGMESRKAVLREVAVDLGFPVLENRTKKASQYGSGTTDLIRGVARAQGKMFNEFVTDICDDALSGEPLRIRGSMVNARIDAIVKAKAEAILREQGISPSECIEAVYRRIIESGRFD